MGKNLDKFNLEAWSGNTPASKKKSVLDTTSIVSNVYTDCDSNKDDFLAVVQELVNHRIDITEGYPNWVKLGFALSDFMGEAGREVFHNLSQFYPRYSYEECDRQYTYCMRSCKSGVTIKTFFQMAKEAGIDVAEIAASRCRLERAQADFSAVSAFPQSDKIYPKNSNCLISNDSVDLCNTAETAETAEIADRFDTFSDKLDAEELCPFAKDVMATQHEASAKDMMLMGSIVVMSAFLPNLFGIYRRRKYYPNLFMFIVGRAASNKGDVNAVKQIAKPIYTEIRKMNEMELAEYKDKMANMAKGPSKEKGEAPIEPPFRSPYIPANSSATAAYQALNDNLGWGLMFETEADTVTQAFKSDYGDYSAGLRLIYEHEQLSYSRRKDKEHVEINYPRLSVLLSCTPGQIPALLPSAENGLASRFTYYNIPRNYAWLDVFDETDKTLDDIFEGLGNRFYPLYQKLKRWGEPGIQFLFTKEQKEEFNNIFSYLKKEQIELMGDDIIASVHRLGVIFFRIAMVLTMMRAIDEDILDELDQAVTCDERDFRTAKVITNCLMNHTMFVFGNIIKPSEENSNPNVHHMTPQEQKVYNALPYEFQKKDFDDTVLNLGIPTKTAERYIGNFINRYKVATRIKQGCYRKI